MLKGYNMNDKFRLLKLINEIWDIGWESHLNKNLRITFHSKDPHMLIIMSAFLSGSRGYLEFLQNGRSQRGYHN